MKTRIIAFLMGIVLSFCNLFGIDYKGTVVAETFTNYIYQDASYGDHERQKLDLYIPKLRGDELGLVLYIHGGGWVAGDKEGYRNDIREMAKMGYAAACINYRYLSYDVSFDDILTDIEAALSFIRTTGKEKNISIDKVLLTGYSAGGHLSMLYAYARKDSSPVEPVAVVDYCGPTDLYDPSFYNESSTDELKNLFLMFASYSYGQELTLDNAYLAEQVLKKASPIYYVDENTVPTVKNHGMADTLVPYSNALSLEEAFVSHGVTHILNTFPNSGHGLENDPYHKKLSDQYFEDYVKTYLG